MDNFNATQAFDAQNYEDNDEGPASPDQDQDPDDGQYETQAFRIPGTSAFDVNYDAEEGVQGTQAFDVNLQTTQAFSAGAFDDTPSDDPILTIDSTQQFAVAEFATVADASSANDTDYSVDGQNFVVVEGGGEFDGNYEEQEVAGEEVVAGDGEEMTSNVGDMDEIASPDPEPEPEEEEEEEQNESTADVRRANRISSDDDEDQHESDGESGDLSKKRRSARVLMDDDDESGGAGGEEDEPEAEKKSEVGELIANIFGDSDDEGDSDKEEEKDEQSTSHVPAVASDDGTKDDSDDDLRVKGVVAPDFVSDFDLMMERRRAENRRRYRKRKDYDIVNDADDVINEMINQMKQAAKKDSELHKEQKPALSKRKLLPTVVKQLKKADLHTAFIELGVITVIADWLSPLPDGSLPALEVRTELLKVLEQLPSLPQDTLKTSGIGKAVMILYKHPKETKANKERAGKLINEWARPIFNLQSDFRSLSKEERLQRDYEHMPLAKKRRLSLDAENKPKSEAEQEERPLRPGDKGWIGRARVPQPSTKDYVVRPKWNVEGELRKATNKKGASLIERKIKEIKERTKPKKASRAVGVSIEGKKML